MMLWSVPARAQWGNAQLFNDPGEAGADVKTARIASARTGGFHAIYHANNRVRYRRFSGGVLSPIVDVFPGANFSANGYIAEALNGDIHVVLEDWAGDAPEVRWYKSTNGGTSFPATQVISNSGGCSKHPEIAALGVGAGSEILMSYFRSGTTGSCNKSLYFSRYNGSTWSAEASIGSNSHSEYDCFGICRSPADGSVYRSFDINMSSMSMRQYASGWSGEIPLQNTTWSVRQHMAINASGQVMLFWDSNERIQTLLYTPGAGPSSITDMGAAGYTGSVDVCWIPGTNDFFMALAKPVGGGKHHVVGRRWVSGVWQTEESIENGQVDAFTVTPVVTADTAGNLYCVWEYWGSNKPQQWYAVRPASVAAGPKGTIAGKVVDNIGQPVSSVAVNVSGAGSTVTQANGTYSILVPVGTRTVDAYKTFYTGQTVPGVVVNENQTTTVNMTITGQPPLNVSSLTATPGNTTNLIQWTNPASAPFSGVRIMFRIGADPASPTDGTVLLDELSPIGAARSFAHNNLTNGKSYRYRAFAFFQDASRFYSSGVTAIGVPFGPADFDHDGDVDQADFGHFQACYTGSTVPQTNPNCQDAKLSCDDLDVDLNDFAIFQRCISGPNIPADPHCADGFICPQ